MTALKTSFLRIARCPKKIHDKSRNGNSGHGRKNYGFDCDGHIIESIAEIVPFLDEVDREIALRPSRTGRACLPVWTQFITRATCSEAAK